MNLIRKILSITAFLISLFLFLLMPTYLSRSVRGESSVSGFILFLSLAILLFLISKWLWFIPKQVNKSASNPTDLQDSVVVKVPVGIQYEIKLSSPDPANQAPEVLSYQYEFLPLTGFPGSLFFLKGYNGWKFLVALFLLLSSVYFLTGFPSFLSIQNDWSNQKATGLIPFLWDSLWGNGASKKISSTVDLFVRFFIFICSYCLAWVVFDPKESEGYAMGFFNTLIGIVYMVTPLDFIPDVVPLFGTLDDTFLGAGMVLLGSSSWYKARLRDTNTDTVLQLINEGNDGRAIQLLLKDKGISVKSKK